jgi:hypothetical protein
VEVGSRNVTAFWKRAERYVKRVRGVAPGVDK